MGASLSPGAVAGTLDGAPPVSLTLEVEASKAVEEVVPG